MAALMGEWKMNHWKSAVLMLLLIVNLTTFAMMGADKRRARKGSRRIPEKTLFCAAGLFGALGGVLGMQLFRHKTKHWYFQLFFPLMLVVQSAMVIAAFLLL